MMGQSVRIPRNMLMVDIPPEDNLEKFVFSTFYCGMNINE
jgi:hypothetical protein